MDAETFLEHYGVKGMKWGVRRDRSGASGPTEVSVIAPTGKRIRTSGGSGHPASEEAIKTASTKQKSRASGVRSLSNKEIQDAVRRMQLEKQFNELSAKPGILAKGQKFAKSLLGLGDTANRAVTFANSPAGKQLKDALKNDN